MKLVWPVDKLKSKLPAQKRTLSTWNKDFFLLKLPETVQNLSIYT